MLLLMLVLEKCHVQPRDEAEVEELEAVVVGSHSPQDVELELEDVDVGETVLEEGSQSGHVLRLGKLAVG